MVGLFSLAKYKYFIKSYSGYFYFSRDRCVLMASATIITTASFFSFGFFPEVFFYQK